VAATKVTLPPATSPLSMRGDGFLIAR
jgi:hypothetical protein